MVYGMLPMDADNPQKFTGKLILTSSYKSPPSSVGTFWVLTLCQDEPPLGQVPSMTPPDSVLHSLHLPEAYDIEPFWKTFLEKENICSMVHNLWTACPGLPGRLGQSQRLLRPHFFSATCSCFPSWLSLWVRCQHILFLSSFLWWEVYRGSVYENRLSCIILSCLVIPALVCGFQSGSTWCRSHKERGSCLAFWRIHSTMIIIFNSPAPPGPCPRPQGSPHWPSFSSPRSVQRPRVGPLRMVLYQVPPTCDLRAWGDGRGDAPFPRRRRSLSMCRFRHALRGYSDGLPVGSTGDRCVDRWGPANRGFAAPPSQHFCLFVCFEVELIYNVVLVAGVQHSDSVIHMYSFSDSFT